MNSLVKSIYMWILDPRWSDFNMREIALTLPALDKKMYEIKALRRVPWYRR